MFSSPELNEKGSVTSLGVPQTSPLHRSASYAEEPDTRRRQTLRYSAALRAEVFFPRGPQPPLEGGPVLLELLAQVKAVMKESAEWENKAAATEARAAAMRAAMLREARQVWRSTSCSAVPSASPSPSTVRPPEALSSDVERLRAESAKTWRRARTAELVVADHCRRQEAQQHARQLARVSQEHLRQRSGAIAQQWRQNNEVKKRISYATEELKCQNNRAYEGSAASGHRPSLP